MDALSDWSKEIDALNLSEQDRRAFKMFCAKRIAEAIDAFVVDGTQGITAEQLEIVTALGYVKG